MAVGKLSSRTSLTDPVTGPVAVVRGCLVEVVDRVSDRCMAPGSGIPDPAVVFTEIRYVGQLITETLVDDRS